MRVVLEVLNGPFEGRKAWLRAGQTLRIGRTERSDFAVPHDAKMSNLHFSLECGLGLCMVRDCGSTNGILVNDAPVAEQMLADGDVITAGSTRFRLRVEGAQPQTAVGPGATVQIVPPRQAAPVAPQATIPCRASTCNSGLTLWSSATGEPKPAQVAGQVTALGLQLVLIADFTRANQPLPPELQQPRYLFDWMPPDVARTASPVVLTREDAVDPLKTLGVLWGMGAVVAFYTNRPLDQFLAHLRGMAQGRKRPDGPLNPRLLVGVCWPGTLLPMLRDGALNSYAYLYSLTSVVFLEGDSPEEWQLLMLPDMAPKLQRAGFVPLAEPPAPAV
jgi:hypothetical protein